MLGSVEFELIIKPWQMSKSRLIGQADDVRKAAKTLLTSKGAEVILSLVFFFFLNPKYTIR
jgi:hypothetical protein